MLLFRLLIHQTKNGGFNMFNFKEELSKYQPILELEEIQDSLHPSQLKDLMDILESIADEKTVSFAQSSN